MSKGGILKNGALRDHGQLMSSSTAPELLIPVLLGETLYAVNCSLFYRKQPRPQ
jgi:hypothetical protein